MAFIDYYKIMGIPKNTPQSEIRKAYLKRTKQFHPDLHPDDPKSKAKFQALNEAYAVLSDPKKRSLYDRYGEQWEQANNYEQARSKAQAPNGGVHFSFNGEDDFDFNHFTNGTSGFSTFFENLFKQDPRQQRRNYSSTFYTDESQFDMNAVVTIDLYTALLGGDILIQTKSGKLRVKVKPETQNGTKIRLQGKGYQKPNGTFGNLIVTYNVKLPQNLTQHQRDLLKRMRDEKIG